MKVFIWIVCCSIFGMVQNSFKRAGIILGALPTTFLTGLTFAAARTLCRAWDKKRGKISKEAAQEPQSGNIPPLSLDAWNAPGLSVNQEPASEEDEEQSASNQTKSAEAPIALDEQEGRFQIDIPDSVIRERVVDVIQSQTRSSDPSPTEIISEKTSEEEGAQPAPSKGSQPSKKGTRIALIVVSSLLFLSLVGLGITGCLLLQNPYESGYSDGYETGEGIGYKNGYQEGLGNRQEAYQSGLEEGIYCGYMDSHSEASSLYDAYGRYLRGKRLWERLCLEGETYLSFHEWYGSYDYSN